MDDGRRMMEEGRWKWYNNLKRKTMKKSNKEDVVPNDYGIMIKKCCGSCHNRGFDDG